MIVAGLAMLAASMPQDPLPGIDRALAKARKQTIQDVEYDLRFAIEDGGAFVEGSMWLRFRLASQPVRPLVLDFAGTEITDTRVNNQDTPFERVHNHLLVPADLLAPGLNGIHATFRSKVAPTGTPLTVYRDRADGKNYYYTLLVPADAHGLFPCFDQPDLRARFRLELDVPDGWRAVANTAVDEDAESEEPASNGTLWHFEQSKPLPTYLFAFACGPFAELNPPHPQIAGITTTAPMRILLRGSKLADFDDDTAVKLHHEGLVWLTNAFDVPYPFDKLDLVLAPGFPYGGMEHAGAIFYRESALVFDHPPTVDEQVRRSTLVYHELSHQWFGNLVTMKWFDDLWLKEGFATFYGYRAMNALEPDQRAWLRFLQRVKPRAYSIDATAGTTPVYQELQNLADAKSAYGAIVYNKAPAVLRALFSQLGPTAFQVGVKNFLEKHAFDNADWRDLAAALEGAARSQLGRWSERWLLAPSMPQVRVGWQVDDAGNVREAAVTQRPLGGDEDTWPMDLELLIVAADGERRTVTVASDAERTAIDGLVGKPAPLAILANPQDVAYGQFVPDPRSTSWLLANLPAEPDPLVKACGTAALYEAVREAELDPLRFADMLLQMLVTEADADTHRWLLSRLGTCLFRYLPTARARQLVARTETLLLERIRAADEDGSKLSSFRFLAANMQLPATLALCRDVAGSTGLPFLTYGKQDRFLAAAALLAAGDGQQQLAALRTEFANTDIAKELFVTEAARADAETKEKYWQLYLQLGDPPEQWTQQSLDHFHWPGQQALTLPYLQKALQRVDWVKQNRRIFFMPAWLDAFINGHDSPEALAIVDAFLADNELSDDVRRKVLQSRDGLARAVRIRAAFANRDK